MFTLHVDNFTVHRGTKLHYELSQRTQSGLRPEYNIFWPQTEKNLKQYTSDDSSLVMSVANGTL